MEKCIICNHTNLKNFSLGDVKLVKCNTCGITFNFEMPNESYLEDYYKSDYKLKTSDLDIDDEFRRIFRLPEQMQILQYIQTYLEPGASILDIGCDKGYFLDEARRYGFETTGVEPSQSARAYAENIGLNVHSDVILLEEEFDAIVMWHSLEHHHDPVISLMKYYDLLKPKGLIFIRVPNFDCFWRKVFKSKWIWFQPENHYFHYNLQSLQFILEKSGFKIELIESRKPNNSITKKMGVTTNYIRKKLYKKTPTLKKRIGRIYEDVTGVELFAVASK